MEVYPAATLKVLAESWGIQLTYRRTRPPGSTRARWKRLSYKSDQRVRRSMVKSLLARLHISDWSVRVPKSEEVASAAREGWIFFPVPAEA